MANISSASAEKANTRDLSSLPKLTFTFVENYIREKQSSGGNNEIGKGYKYFCEKYITDIRVFRQAGGHSVKAKSFRSQKRNESPHEIEVVLREGPDFEECLCSCAIGKGGGCGHIAGLLYTLAHMLQSGMKCVPQDTVKTSLPQTWHVPRGEKICASSSDKLLLHGYDVKTPMRPTRGLRTTLYNPLLAPITQDNLYTFAGRIADVDKDCLFLSVAGQQTNLIPTKFGHFPKGSPIAVQQKQHSQYIINILDDIEFPPLPYNNFIDNHLSMVLDDSQTTSLCGLQISMSDSIKIEEMTRLQGNDPRWHAVRKDRLTASTAGDIVKRKADNPSLAKRLRSTRRVVTEAMRHGLACEPIAADKYVQIHDGEINIFPCGVVVSPHACWLAASPDRKVFNPIMNPPYGLLEIKCPVNPISDCVYLTKHQESGTYKLKTSHNYYYQVMMQLAVTGLEWCHFLVWRPDEFHLEKITFDPVFWQHMKNRLDIFFFCHYL